MAVGDVTATAGGEPAGTRPASGGGELELRGINKSFGALQVLRNISFTVQRGQFVTLLGPSGCGKMTLLRIIAGLEMADAGQVVLGGSRITSLPANRRPVNNVFQSYALFPHLRVFDNIAFGLRSRRFPAAEIASRVARAVDMLQLEKMEHRYPHELSGGQKQRVALARALVNEPEVLLLDEPMSALDAKLRVEVQLDLRRLQQRLGKTFILVTHDQDEAMTVSDRILVMNAGQIEQSGRPSDVYEHPVNRFVAEFLGLANLIPAARANGTTVDTALGPMHVRTQPGWERGTLAIRPERIRVVPSQPAANGVSSTIRELIYRGDHIDLFLEPGSLRVRVAPTLQLAVGQKVWIELASEHLEVLDD